MAIKDGTHLPTNKFRENYDSIFGKKKKEKRLSPETTKQFLKRISKEK